MPEFAIESPIQTNLTLLAQASAFLEEMPVELYRATEPPAFLSPIGAHMRHILDHYDSLIEGTRSGVVDYHSRKRDPETESDPAKAMKRISFLNTELTGIAANGKDLDIPLSLRVSGEDPYSTVSTSLPRELYFSISHTIHHFALISMVGRHLGFRFPEDFGVAPSTLAHRKKLTGLEAPATPHRK